MYLTLLYVYALYVRHSPVCICTICTSLSVCICPICTSLSCMYSFSVGTVPVTRVDTGTSPMRVKDLKPVVDELKGKLKHSQKDLQKCRDELAEANSVIGIQNKHIERYFVLLNLPLDCYMELPGMYVVIWECFFKMKWNHSNI